jgi:hypothetical protein
MPRLEIETIDDFKTLHEIGALTPDMTIKLSRILLGEDPGQSRKKRKAVSTEPFPENPRGEPGGKNPRGEPAGKDPRGEPDPKRQADPRGARE